MPLSFCITDKLLQTDTALLRIGNPAFSGLIQHGHEHSWAIGPLASVPHCSAADPGAAGGLSLEQQDLAAACRGFKPAASWGVGAATPSAGGPRGWQDVGGLEPVVAALREALELPLRHARLVAK